ncbi:MULTISPECIES: DUF7168 domain-containing protein [Symbiopectobacterium]|uniref:DUF7168 domain-containing protein n=1 Tax=Symbiopectobacterium TaxID=801 RepID=UPI001A294CCA|nr:MULTISPECIES: hypothetical protein [Symbiopectobacterium]MBG6248154.1 hypothetical protein [Candidatus Symbiopectobacterium sp. PLON1]MBT9430954.1 hypothetical protein [Candidatus Symbiopectobacterium endolongispinus]
MNAIEFNQKYKVGAAFHHAYPALRGSHMVKTVGIARADTFCEGWVLGVWQVIDSFVVTDTEATLISAYHHKLQQRTGLKSVEMRDAKKARGTEDARCGLCRR